MKKKLTIDEQIEDLKKKGVTFEIMSEEEAKKFLRYNNYYFKLKSYAKNYPINPKNGKYVNSDLPKYLSNFPYFTGFSAHSLVK